MVNKNNDNDVLASSENMDQEETTAGYGMKKTRILYDNKKETAAGIWNVGRIFMINNNTNPGSNNDVSKMGNTVSTIKLVGMFQSSY